jgi:hypothetical protein
LGTQTTINSVNTDIADNIITLNSGLAANVAPTLDAGISVNRGNAAEATLRWNETLDRWEVNGEAIIFGSSTSFTIVNDPNPTLGGDLNVGNNYIVSNTNVTISPAGDTVIDSDLRLLEWVPHHVPTPEAGWITFAGGEPTGGDSGVFITNSKVSDAELITKRKAIVYSLIF